MKTIDELGLEMWRLRKERKLSQREAAERIGKCQSTWGEWERGAVVPSIASLHKIAEVVPLDLARWEPVVAEYHKQWKHKANRTFCGGPERQEYGKVAAMIRDKPNRKKLKTKRSSIGEIARAARAEGLTYGEYIARHGL